MRFGALGHRAKERSRDGRPFEFDATGPEGGEAGLAEERRDVLVLGGFLGHDLLEDGDLRVGGGAMDTSAIADHGCERRASGILLSRSTRMPVSKATASQRHDKSCWHRKLRPCPFGTERAPGTRCRRSATLEAKPIRGRN
jgi:hypothetical protein